MTNERRSITNQATIETRSDGTRVIAGYAAVFYRDADSSTEFRAGDMIERVHRGAFDAVLASSDDVVADFDHRSDTILGRRSNGTLSLSVDDVGLRYEVPFDESDPDHVRVAAKINRNDVRGSSFGFRVEKRGVKWTGNVRNITQFDKLFSVGPVVRPAYDGTSATMRSVESALDELAEQQRQRDRDVVAVTRQLIKTD